jgi:hypothetical protein
MTMRIDRLMASAMGEKAPGDSMGELQLKMAQQSVTIHSLELERDALKRELAAARSGAAASPVSGDNVLREKLNQLAAEVVAMAARLEGPQSRINTLLDDDVMPARRRGGQPGRTHQGAAARGQRPARQRLTFSLFRAEVQPVQGDAPAVATLRLSKPGAISIDSVSSRSSHSSASPWPSLPSTSAWRDAGCQSADFDASGRRQGGDGEAVLREPDNAVFHRGQPEEGNPQHTADGDADRLAIERIATFRIEQYGIDAEGGGIAEDAAHIVVVGNAGKNQHAFPGGGKRLRQPADSLGNARDGENAAMHVKAGNGVHHRLRRAVNRYPGGQGGDHVGDPGDAVFQHQQRLHREAG